MGTKLFKFAFVVSSTIVTFAAGVGAGTLASAYIFMKGGTASVGTVDEKDDETTED